MTTPAPAPKRPRRFKASALAAILASSAPLVGIVVAHPDAEQTPPLTTTTVAVPGSAPPSTAGCSTTTDATPAGIPPTQLPTGPTNVELPNGTELARPHLKQIIQRVRTGPAGPPVCGRYDYVHVTQWTADTTVSGGQGTTQLTMTDYQRWRAADASGRVITYRQEPAAATPEQHAVDYTRGTFPASLRTPLSTDPGILAREIDAVYHWSRGNQAGLRATADIYSWHIPSRDLRVALLQILSDTDDLLWRGTATDRVGRTGIAVSVDSHAGATRDLLILNPATGKPLAYEQVAVRNPGRLNGPFPKVLVSTVFLSHERRLHLN